MKEADIVETIAVNQRMKYINLCDCPFVGHPNITAILGFAEHIEQIVTSCHIQASLVYVQALLSHFKKLEALRSYAPGFRCLTPAVKSQSAAEFISMEWASFFLREFGCIFRVPRPDDQVPSNYRDDAWNSPTVEQSHEIQRQVYRHIAQQKRLAKLNLGALKDQDPELLWYSLEVTLESGLDEPVGLKGMQTLKLDHVNHRIKIKELNWMYENWPEPHRISGLCPLGEDIPEDIIKQWKRVHCYDVSISGCYG